VSGAVLEAAVSAVGGKVNNKDAFMAALKKTSVPTARGYVKFDDLGNVVGDVYIRQVARKEGRLVNSVIKTYSNISQYWTYDPKQFLANPVYSRDWPPAKNIES
jgi:branched-chain amino acid transport system substrate-binding protein